MIVRGCIAFRRGDTLIEMVSLGHRDLAVAIAEAAYRAGAVAVDVQYEDGACYAAKIANAPTQGARLPDAVAGRAVEGDRHRAGRDRPGDGRARARHASPTCSPERVAADTGGREPARRAHSPRGEAPRDDLRLADGRMGGAGVPRARRGEGDARAREGPALVLPARAGGPARPQGLDGAPRDPAAPRGAADEARSEGGARPRPRHEPAPPASRRSRCGAAAASETTGAGRSR